MSIPNSPIGPNADTAVLISACRQAAAAAIASGIIAASGRAHSVDEALALLREVSFSMYPQHASGNYQNWQQHKDTTKPHV